MLLNANVMFLAGITSYGLWCVTMCLNSFINLVLPQPTGPDIRMPLIKELEVIKGLRDGKDIILIDDLRLYTKDNFESGNLPDELMSDGYDYMVKMFEKTHVIKKYVNDEGYLEMIPKLRSINDRTAQ